MRRAGGTQIFLQAVCWAEDHQKREAKHDWGNFFLREFLAKEFKFSRAEQQQGAIVLLALARSLRLAQQQRRRERRFLTFVVEMATSGLRDRDRLDGASNYVIWKANLSFFLDEHALKTYVDSVVAVLANPDPLKKYRSEMAKSKRMILDGVKDHVVCHVASRGNAKEMWDALATLYQGSSKQRKMYLEQKLRSAQMLKEERVDPFLTKLKETRDELSAAGHTPPGSELVRLALNSVLDELG